MNFRRRLRILTSRKSPSTEMMKRTYNRAFSNGGVVQDFTANVENLRSLSRALGYDNVDRGGVAIRRNMIQWSESFDNALWVRQNTAISINAITAPDGNTTAEKFIASSANGFHLVYQLVSGGVVNTTYTASMYAKAGEVSNVAINNSDGIVGLIYSFDLISGTYVFASGTIGTSTASITNVGNGWWRCSVTRTMGSTIGSSIGFQVNGSDSSNNITYSGDNTSGLYLWGFQYEKNNITTEYQATTTAVVYPYLAPASFTYVPASYGEGKNFTEVHNKRNLLQYSEDFANVYWTAGAINATLTNLSSPLSPNQTDISKITGILGGYPQFGRLVSGLKIGKVYTFSIYVMTNDNTTDSIDIKINNVLVNRFKPTNQWVRYSGKYIATSTSHGVSFVIVNTNTDKSFYIWGAQFEEKDFPTPYQKMTVASDGIVDFNFTRATPATVTNKLGIIEDSCYNLLQYSENFSNSFWAKTAITVTPNAAIAPNGTLTAFSYLENTANTNHLIQLSSPASNAYPVGTTLTWSVYIKANGSQWVLVNLYNVTDYAAYFDLTNGAVGNILGTGVQPRITNVGNGWFRCSVTKTTTTANVTDLSINAVLSNGGGSTRPGTGSAMYYIWGAQLEQASAPRPYLKTVNRLNVPRLDYSRSTSKPNLLIEPQRANLILRSSELENSYWLKNNVTIASNSVVGPDGYTLADSMLETTTNAGHYIDTVSGIATTVGTTYTRSLYIKSNGRQWVILDFFNSTDFVAWFDIINGVIGTVDPSITASIKNAGNGWWRCSITRQATLSTTYNGVIIALADGVGGGYVGDITKGLYIWGQQFEQGSIATSYIPTTTATVTRNNETNYVDLWNNAMLNRQNWTLFWEGYLYDGSGTNISFALSDTTTASSDTNQIGWDSQLRPFYNISNTRTNSTGSTYSNNTFNRFVMQYNNGILNCYINGMNVWSNQSVPVFDYRYLVLNSGGSSFATDKISLWTRTLTSSESIKLTNKLRPISDQSWYRSSDMKFYLKFNNNLVDQTGLYSNGVGTNIGYRYGLSNSLGLDSVVFNGTSSYIQMPDGAFYADSQTVSFWVKANDVATGVFYTLGSDYDGGGWGIVISHTLSSISIGLVTASPVVNNNYTGPDVKSVGEWFHMAVVYDNVLDVSKTYVNGILIATKSLGVGNLLRGSSKVVLGVGNTNTPKYGFMNGELADFAVIKRVLTVAEIQSLQKPI